MQLLRVQMQRLVEFCDNVEVSPSRIAENPTKNIRKSGLIQGRYCAIVAKLDKSETFVLYSCEL